MPEFEISPLDISNAEEYLATLLREKFPDLDTAKGSVLRDLLISPFAFIYVTIRKQIEQLRSRQSLLTLSQLPSDVNVDELVDQILSNWMLTRGSGNYARGRAIVYLSASVDVVVPATTQFVKKANLIFYPDIDEELFVVPRNNLKKSVDANGNVIGYFFELPLKAAQPGTAYNIEAGNFVSWTNFSNAVVRVMNAQKFTGGKDAETTAELITRAKTAVSIRDLNSVRSIDALLRENFSSIRALAIKGFGEYVLRRNYYAPLGIHLGGFADVFVRTEMLFDRVYETVVGLETEDPRPGFYVFKDATISDFTALIPPAQAQEYILHVYDMPHNEPALYKIAEVVPNELRVSREQCFPRQLPKVIREVNVVAVTTQEFEISDYIPSLTDIGRYLYLSKNPTNNIGVYKIIDVDPLNRRVTVNRTLVVAPDVVSAELCVEMVKYTVGNDFPQFSNKISDAGNPLYSGRLTKLFGTPGRILLPFLPVYYIKEITIPGTWYPAWADNDNKIRFKIRKNSLPTEKGEFFVSCKNPEESNSGWQLSEVFLAIPPGKNFDFWDGASATVVYDTLQDYNAIWDFMLDDFRRVVCASIIPRGMFAAYLNFTINYSLKPRGELFSHSEAVDKLVNFVNTFAEDTLDVSDIVVFLRQEYPAIGTIFPFQIDYFLYAPDGRVIPYRTTDRVSIDVSYQVGTTTSDRLENPLNAGISDDLVFYITRNDMINLVRV